MLPGTATNAPRSALAIRFPLTTTASAPTISPSAPIGQRLTTIVMRPGHPASAPQPTAADTPLTPLQQLQHIDDRRDALLLKRADVNACAMHLNVLIQTLDRKAPPDAPAIPIFVTTQRMVDVTGLEHIRFVRNPDSAWVNREGQRAAAEMLAIADLNLKGTGPYLSSLLRRGLVIARDRQLDRAAVQSRAIQRHTQARNALRNTLGWTTTTEHQQSASNGAGGGYINHAFQPDDPGGPSQENCSASAHHASAPVRCTDT